LATYRTGFILQAVSQVPEALSPEIQEIDLLPGAFVLEFAAIFPHLYSVTGDWQAHPASAAGLSVTGRSIAPAVAVAPVASQQG
jgi:hypothetical protein